MSWVEQLLMQRFLGGDQERRLAAEQETEFTEEEYVLQGWRFSRSRGMYKHAALPGIFVDVSDRQAFYEDRELRTLTPLTKKQFLEYVGPLAQVMVMPDLREEGEEEEERKPVEEPEVVPTVSDQWVDIGGGYSRYWCSSQAREFLYVQTGLLYESQKGRHRLLYYERGPAMTLTSLEDTSVTQVFCATWNENANMCEEVEVVLGKDWVIPEMFEQPFAVVACNLQGHWTLRALDTDERILFDGKRVGAEEVVLVDQSVVQICGKVELRVSIAPWMEEAMPPEALGEAVEALTRAFVPKEEPEAKPLVPQESGTQRAYRLNMALRRALCSAYTKEEQSAAEERKERYQDRADQRRERHGYNDYTDQMDERAAAERIRDMEGVDVEYRAPKRRNIYDKPVLDDGSFQGESKGERPGLGLGAE